ncbi:MAG: hypothetical protein HY343_09060 [Lentisphaerae bacterium]|nr:hypothetical protein [Lentisphaerota bacterium]
MVRFVMVLLAALILAGADARAQTAIRKAAPAPGAVPVGAPAATVKIRSLTVDKVKTPEYSSDASESTGASKQWGRVSVKYDTAPEWADDLEFRYFVVVKNKDRQSVMFTANMSYIEVAKGVHHSAVFLRPNTLERYGEIEQAAVEIYYKGELAASESTLKDDKSQWWRTAKVKTLDGILLNRDQTPFAFVAWDNYETIKAR